MGATTALIMAAGSGTRMRSELPKVLHPLCGRPLIEWPIEAARAAGVDKIVVICAPDDGVRQALPADIEVVVQTQAAGTGDAVRCAAGAISQDSDLLVLSGDSPLVSSQFITAFVDQYRTSDKAALLASCELDDPSGYGRIVRDSDGRFLKVVETKHEGDASGSELQIREINTGTYCFSSLDLFAALERIDSNNAQGELYLGDVFPFLADSGKDIGVAKFEDNEFALGINTRVDLALVRAVAQRRIIESHMLAGVTVVDPASTTIDVGVKIAPDVTVEPFCTLRGDTEIGEGATIGPVTNVIDAKIGAKSCVTHSYLERCELGPGCVVGPYSYLRPGTELADSVKVGASVEIKNSRIGSGTKVPHLSYIGDADIGPNSNIGAGNITANYDGTEKHRTVIGKNVKTGVDTSLVAPVILGDNSYTGAGSVITDDVPDGALGIARSRQTNREGFSEEKEANQEHDSER